MQRSKGCPRAAARHAEPLEERRLLAASLPANQLGTASPGDHFSGIVADPARNHVFIGRVSPNALIVIDSEQGKQIAVIPLAAAPASLAMTPDGSSVLVVETNKHQVEVVSTSTLSSQRVVNVGVPLLEVAGGIGGKFYGLATTDTALAAPDDPNATYNARSVGEFDLTTGHRDRVLDLANGSDQFLRSDTASKRLYIGQIGGWADDGGDLAHARVFDISNAAAPKELPSVMGAGGHIVDLFADSTAGQIYTARLEDGVIERRTWAGAIIAKWQPPPVNDGYGWEAVGITGAAGSPYVFGIFTDWGKSPNLRVVAFDVATGAVRRTYDLPDENASATAVVTPNGRVTYLGREDLSTISDSHADAWLVGLIGATSLQLDHTHNVISGSVFYDANGDGVRQSDEAGWIGLSSSDPGVVVYVDLNNNGKLDAEDADMQVAGDEPHAFLYDNIAFRLKMPTTSGTYAVRMEVHGWSDSTPYVATSAALRSVTLGDGAQAGNINFGITPGVRIIGTVFADVNGDGVSDYLSDGNTGEPDVSGAQVYLDVNNDGRRNGNEPISDVIPADSADEPYRSGWLYNLVAPAGPIVVRLLNPKGYVLSGQAPTSVTVDGIAGGRHVVNFAVRPQLAVQGTLFNDANGNGKRDGNEGPLVGARVWLDLNGNGRFAKGEPSGVPGSDGHYVIQAKERGTGPLNVRARDAAGGALAIARKSNAVTFNDWKQTITDDFGAFSPATLSVTAFLDADRNRKHNKGDRWLANTIVFIDFDRDGRQDKNEPSAITNASGHATFSNLSPGSYLVSVRVSSKLGKTRGASFTTTLDAGQTLSTTAAIRRA